MDLGCPRYFGRLRGPTSGSAGVPTRESLSLSHCGQLLTHIQIIKALHLIRHPLAYTGVDRVIEILALSNLDPIFVDEAARGFGILAEGKGKGKEKGTHLSTKVSSPASHS